MTDTQRVQATIDQLSLDLPRRLPGCMRDAYLAAYPSPKYGQLIEYGYLTAWRDFARRMEALGYLTPTQLVQPAASSPLARLRNAAVKIIEACDQIAAKGSHV